jgi:hypothetical protein
LGRRRLFRELPDGKHAAEALWALDDMSPADAAPVLTAVLQGQPSGTMSAALGVIERTDDPDWCPAVHALFRWLDPGAPSPQSYLWITSLKFLLRHGHQREELLAALPAAAADPSAPLGVTAADKPPNESRMSGKPGMPDSAGRGIRAGTPWATARPTHPPQSRPEDFRNRRRRRGQYLGS